MIIDCENKLTDKQIKELKTSLNLMINNIVKYLKKKQNNVDKTVFNIVFNNGDKFSIICLNKYFNKVSYINKYGEEQDIIPLQSALNINKYVKDIENNIKIHRNNLSFIAYYTEQPIDKIIPLYAKDNTSLRKELYYKNYCQYVDIVKSRNNFLIDEKDIDID